MCEYKDIFKMHLRVVVIQYRIDHGLTQEAMAELLHISSRAYCAMEQGDYSFSATTFAFFLRLLPPEEVSNFLNQFGNLIEQMEMENELLPV